MRKFYRTLLTLEILSEYDPVTDMSLADINYAITEGDYSGVMSVQSFEQLTSKQMADCTIAQGSDPEFFGLDATGNDVLEHELGLNLKIDNGYVYANGDVKDGK